MSVSSRLLLALLSGCGGGSWFSSERLPPEEVRCKINPNTGCFQRVEGATFLMGAQSTDPAAPGYDPAAGPSEGPVREVTVPTFWIQEEELIFFVWKACVEAGACNTTAPGEPSPGMDAHRDAAGGLTWDEARQVCAYKGARLPTEAEWELAARGKEGRRWPWGNHPPCGLGTSRHYFDELPTNEWNTIAGCEQSERPQNPRGFSPDHLMDLAWGHWEWVQDDFAGPPGGPPLKVQRGGSWAVTDPLEVRTTVRAGMPPDSRVFDVGVRCAY